MSTKSCLVTGYVFFAAWSDKKATDAVLLRGTGYIASFTALALLEAGYKVVLADNLYNSSKEVIHRIELITGKRPDFIHLDVRDENAFDNVFSKHPDIDSVIHFAALKVSRRLGNIERNPIF